MKNVWFTKVNLRKAGFYTSINNYWQVSTRIQLSTFLNFMYSLRWSNNLHISCTIRKSYQLLTDSSHELQVIVRTTMKTTVIFHKHTNRTESNRWETNHCIMISHSEILALSLLKSVCKIRANDRKYLFKLIHEW